MENNFRENKYFNTYYYSNIVNNILTKDIELIGFLSNYFSCEATLFTLAKPFEKYSAFHGFIEYMIGEFFENDMNEEDQRIFKYYQVNSYPLEKLYAESVLDEFDLSYPFSTFIEDKKRIEWPDIEKYHEELHLSGTLEELYVKISSEVFYLMFNNRNVLLRFNYIVAEYLREISLDHLEEPEIKKFFNKKGYPKRIHIPEWVKRAVFFRDRGRCCKCGKDLSNLFSVEHRKNFDHIVPLGLGGINDISNIQLLCSNCNQVKNKRQILSSNFYEFWY
jgi:hypothetical protein